MSPSAGLGGLGVEKVSFIIGIGTPGRSACGFALYRLNSRTYLHRKICLWKFKVVFVVDLRQDFSSTHMSTKSAIGLDTQHLVTDTV